MSAVSAFVGVRAAAAEDRSPSFVGDVLPILSKAGCNSSGCHSRPEGQNNFKLSVFSYDPRGDYEEIVSDVGGRRVSPGAPEHSLLLRKATAELPHEGGERIVKGSPEHAAIRRWIAEGMPYQNEGEPALSGLGIEPAEHLGQPGERGQFRAFAEYTDGSRRDVTALATFDTEHSVVVDVGEDGGFTVGEQRGEGTVVARYMGEVAVATLSVPPATIYPDERYRGFEVTNLIDEHALARWRQLGLVPSEPCTDPEFLRRASLSLTGKLPSPDDVRRFLADPAPSADKRRAWVDQRLSDPSWADYWAIKWTDLLRPNPDRAGIKSVYVLDAWIRSQLRAETPYNEFATNVLSASGNTHRDGPAVVFRDRRDPENLTTSMSQIFLGVRLECARCHNHPNERWSQNDFFQMAAFFGALKRKGTGISPPISGSSEFFFHGGGAPSVKHPVSGEPMAPLPPATDAESFAVGEKADPRRALATWLTAPDNPFFARAAVNRVWAEMMGSGFVNPVDDFRVSNPPSNPALLDALAADFVASGFDLKHLMRQIATSSTFALSSLPNETNVADTEHFSRALRRRLPAEVMADAIDDATGVPTDYQGMPPGTRAVENWNFKIASHLLDAFGRPDSSEDCPCERNLSPSVVQSLHLMNAEQIQSKLANKGGRVATLAAGDLPPAELFEELVLAAWGRPPTGEERRLAEAHFARPDATRQSAAEDLMWALLNSAEFVFNH